MVENKRLVVEPIEIRILNGSLEDEEKKYQNELSRIENEDNREKAETVRKENEIKREEAEAQRKSNETDRVRRFNELEVVVNNSVDSVERAERVLTVHNEKIGENSNDIQELKAEQIIQNNSLSDLRDNQSNILNDVGNLKVGQATQDSKIEILEESIKNISTGEGVKGEKGDPFTFDDFTPEQLESLRGEKGEPGVAGVDGKNGADGYTPVKGVDYFTNAEIQEITINISNIIKDYVDEKIGAIDTLLDELNGEVI